MEALRLDGWNMHAAETVDFDCSDLGAHIDGFIAVAAQTVFLQSDSKAAVTGQAADAITAANTALEAALRLVRPGKLISEVCYQD